MLSPRLLLLLILVVPTTAASATTVSTSHSRIVIVSTVSTSAALVVLSIPIITAFSAGDWFFPSLLGFIFLLREKCNSVSKILIVVEASALLELEHSADVLLELFNLDEVLAAFVPHLQVV